MMITRTATTTAHTVHSADGATISYLTIGTGPGVLVIPGALATAATYMAFARALADQFTVHVIDRRGHGRSSPQEANYSMTTECDDVLAVQRETSASLLVGHSFGGLVALEVARNHTAFTKIAVYEPGVSIDGSIPMEWMPRYARYLTTKHYRDAFVVFALGTGPDRARTTPPWLMKLLLPFILTGEERRRMFGLLPENLREHQEVARLDNSYANYREIPAEVLLMYGGQSHSSWVDLSMERLATVLPHAETQEFPKLDHFGIDKNAPREVAAAVNRFFLKKRTTP
jgi:pimeloyl-ACP methyl ester carboxylesterase